jgi:dipeptidyl aminopeptidase/acylaminoacyl peptidase
MKHFLKLLLGILFSIGTLQAQDIAGQPTPLHTLSENIISEIKTITLSDGVETTGRLCIPKNESIRTIVVTVHGTGPYTYITQRPGFNYYDVLADGFCEKGVGFFTYNRRGVDLGDSAPWFDKVDSTKYAKYLPCNEAEDIETRVTFLKNDPVSKIAGLFSME